MVTGHWLPKRHKAMISLARALYLNLSSKICVHWVWVKGHSGNVGNERADCLAQRGRNSPAAFGGRYSLSRFPLPQDFLSSIASTPTSQDALEQESQLLTSAIVHSALSSFASRTPSQARRAHQLNSPESSHLWKQAKKLLVRTKNIGFSISWKPIIPHTSVTSGSRSRHKKKGSQRAAHG